MPDRSERPIMFTSRTLTNAERNYSQIEKEALAIIFAVKKFHQYIYGQFVTIQTDHKPLLGLLAERKGIPSMAAARIQRWAIILSAYDYKLCYRSGNENNNADCMSRLHFDKEFKGKHSVVDNHVFMTELIHASVTVKEVALYTNRDPKLSKVISYINRGWPNKTEEQFKPYFIRRSELSVDNSCVLWGDRVIMPMQLRTKVLEELHDNHSGIVKMKYIARSYVCWPSTDKDIENISKSCTSC